MCCKFTCKVDECPQMDIENASVCNATRCCFHWTLSVGTEKKDTIMS